MIIGCPKEIKKLENRVALIPATVKTLVGLGATVLIEKNAGLGSSISDRAYADAGANIVERASDVWTRANMIVKVKEPLEEEFNYFHDRLTIFTFLHLAAEPVLAQALVNRNVTSIAYETIEEHNELPILKPMSEVAGRMSLQVGAWCLENQHQGKGILLGGVPGVRKGRVVILGAGVVGKNAAKMALGLGADVVMLDINVDKLEEIDDIFGGRIKTVYSSMHSIEEEVHKADLVIGAVLLTGAKAPRLVTKEMIKSMEKGSVVIDVAIDQGGCIETIHRTTHDQPTYIVDGVVHYGVANMPGAVACTSTFALAHKTAPYMAAIARLGIMEALSDHQGLQRGLNTLGGRITHAQVAEALNVEYRSLDQIL